MAQRWHQKASVQVAIVTVAGAIVVSIITVGHQRSELNRNNAILVSELRQSKEYVQDLIRERDKAELKLTSFEAAADKAFPDRKQENRLDLLLNLLNQIGNDLQRVLPYQLSDQQRTDIQSSIAHSIKSEAEHPSPLPILYFLKFPGQSEDAASLLDLLHSAILKTGRQSDLNSNGGISSLTQDGKPWSGVIIGVNDLKTPPFLADAIFQTLERQGIEVHWHQGSGYGTNAVVIWANRIAYGLKNDKPQ